MEWSKFILKVETLKVLQIFFFEELKTWIKALSDLGFYKTLNFVLSMCLNYN